MYSPHLHALLIYMMVAPVWGYMSMALQVGDWCMVLEILVSLCTPVCVGYDESSLRL